MTDEVPGSLFDTLESLIELADKMNTSNEFEEMSQFEPEAPEEFESVLHICDKCSFQSEDIEDFIEHVLNEPHLLTCLQCSTRVARPLHLRKHYGSMHGSARTIQCDDCTYKADSRELLHIHKFVKHISNVYSCITCNQYYSHSNKFCEHLKTHPEPTKIKTGQKILKRNFLSEGHVEGNQFYCDRCPYLTDGERNLLNHISKYHKKDFKCDKCDFAARNSSNLRDHIQGNHEKITYYCDQCAYTTSFRRSLPRHIWKQHEKKFQCDQCSFSGSSPYDLKTHSSKVHNKNHCYKAIEEDKSAERYECEICFIVVKTAPNLSRHKQITHHTVPNLQCEFCDYKAKVKSTLKGHIDQIHKKRRYKCDECDYSHSRKYGISVHKGIKHKQN